MYADVAVTEQELDDAASITWPRAHGEVRLTLEPGASPLVIGRSSTVDVRLDDRRVSGVHAEIFWAQREWWLRDRGSRNGTFVDRSRLLQPVRLNHGSTIRCGDTSIRFTWPWSLTRPGGSSQSVTEEAPRISGLTEADRAFLRVLCGPLLETPPGRSPSNPEIAERLVITEHAVRQRLKGIYRKFDLRGQSAAKRDELVAMAIETGAYLDDRRL